VIYDPRRKYEILSYKQLRIEQHFSSDMVRDIHLCGERLSAHGLNVFVRQPSPS